MKEEKPRNPTYAKSSAYEAVLARVNGLLDRKTLPRAAPQLPIVFITGLPRSGTTLFHQVLAASGSFGYVTNVMARFPAAPAVGADIQALMEPFLTRAPHSFRSRGGGTREWFEPHEFGYFWERIFPFAEHHQPSPAQLEHVDTERLAAELAGLEASVSRPLLFKNPTLVFVLPFLAQTLPTAHFAEITRDPVDVAASILRMREEYYGDRRAWFSVRPGTVDALLDEAPVRQVVSQMKVIGAALRSAQTSIAPSRWLRLSHDELCRTPREVVRRVTAFAGASVDEETLQTLPDAFPVRQSSIASPLRGEIVQALAGP